MKFSAVIVLLAASLAHAQFNSVFALLKTLGLTTQFDCALPCLLESANNIPPPEGLGAVDVICGNINEIAEATKPCTQKCEAKKASDFVTELTKYVCKHAPKRRSVDEPAAAEPVIVVESTPGESPEPSTEQAPVEEPTVEREL